MFEENGFAQLKGKIQILLPEKDIFKKRIRIAFRIYSENWMQKFSISRRTCRIHRLGSVLYRFDGNILEEKHHITNRLWFVVA